MATFKSTLELRRKYDLFGSTAEFMLLDIQEPFASQLMDEAYAFGLKLQKIFNIYDDESELSRLNDKRSLKASPELIRVLSLALEYSRLSGDDYDVTHGKNFLERKSGKQLSKLDCMYRDVHIKNGIITLGHEDVWLDLGSIAKGYIGEMVAQFLMEQGAESGYVNARGDIRFFGCESKVSVKHPRQEGMICTIKVKDAGVATSGDYKQYNLQYNESHILNKKEIISSTIIADDLATADLFATLMLVCGNEKREALLRNRNVKAMTIDKDLKIRYYNGFEELVADAD
jgi:FAD:protein FMN transferase